MLEYILKHHTFQSDADDVWEAHEANEMDNGDYWASSDVGYGPTPNAAIDNLLQVQRQERAAAQERQKTQAEALKKLGLTPDEMPF